MAKHNLKLVSATLALSLVGLIPLACGSDSNTDGTPSNENDAGPSGGTGGTGGHGGTGGGSGGHGGNVAGGGSGNNIPDSGTLDAGTSDASPPDAGPGCTTLNADSCYENCDPQTTDDSDQFLNHCTTADCTPWTGTLTKLGAGCKKLGPGCTLPDLP